jgi:hypothetical protein
MFAASFGLGDHHARYQRGWRRDVLLAMVLSCSPRAMVIAFIWQVGVSLRRSRHAQISFELLAASFGLDLQPVLAAVNLRPFDAPTVSIMRSTMSPIIGV